MDSGVFETTDVLGEPVALYLEQWDGHICPSHPEVAPYARQVRATLESPECVYSSDIREDAKAFYGRHEDTGRYRNLFLKVVVAYDRTPAYVLTAYFCPHITGGDLLWLKQRL